MHGDQRRSAGEERLLDLAAQRMQQSMPAYSRAALIMGCGVQEGGQGSHIIDHEGRRFLDLFDAYGNQSFGYGHPRLLAALRRQLDSGHTNSAKVFFDALPIRLSAALADLTGGALPRSFLTNGGAEAIEHAIKLARAHTRRPKFITAKNAYHGKTIGAISAACRPEYEEMFAPLMPDFHPVPFGDAAAMEAAIDGETAAVLIETVQAEGGIVPPPEGYLARIRAACDRHGALMILDEIQCGFGRSGRFFAFEYSGILPDIVCIGKSFGGGMLAAAAIMARESLWGPFRSEPLAFGSSLGGSPLAAAVGLETLAMATDPAFLAEVRAKGERVGERLRAMHREFPELVRGTAGLGLLHGITLADPALTGLVLRRLFERGVITSFCLFDVNVLRIEPPLVITAAELDGAMDALHAALTDAQDAWRALPKGALGATWITAEAEISADPEALFAELAAPETLFAVGPVVTEWDVLRDDVFACRGRVDDIPMDWTETVAIDATQHEIMQRATDGFWAAFERRWQVRPGTTPGTSQVSLRIAWDVGTDGFERVLSLRLRCSLERELQKSFERLGARLAAGGITACLPTA